MIPKPLPHLLSDIFSRINRTAYFYFILLFAHISLVWLLPFFPTQDGPSHIYNLVILRDLLHGGAEWGNYYYYKLVAVPNLGFNLIAYPLLYFFTPETTEKLFLTFYIALMGTGVPYFLKTFGKAIFPYAYLVFPVVFNFTLMMGFYSYSIAVPIFLIFFSICYKIRNQSMLKKFLLYNLLGVVIYFLHLVAFGIFVISLVSMTLADSPGFKRALIKLLKQLVLISPVIITTFIYLHTNSAGYSNATTEVTYISCMEKLLDLLMFSSVNISMWQTVSGYTFLIVVLTLMLCGIKKLKRTVCSGLNFHDSFAASNICLLYLESTLLLIYLFAPFRFGEASYFNQRFPWVMLLLALPFMRVPVWLFSDKSISRAVIFTALLSLAVNTAVFVQHSMIIESFLGGLSLDFPKGAMAMVYENQGEGFRTDPLAHAISYYGIRKKVVDIGNYEAQFRLFPIHCKQQSVSFLPTYSQIAYSTESIDWARFPSIQYILAWKQNSSSVAGIVTFYDKVFDNGLLSVWRRM